jgi:rRNA small subunit pseudouridine methyltransferase Nep1
MESSETLLKVVKNPITDHLPPDALKVGTSTKAELVRIKSYLAEKHVENKPV